MEEKETGGLSKQKIESIKTALLMLLKAYQELEKDLHEEEVPEMVQKAKDSFEMKLRKLGFHSREPDEILRSYIQKIVFEVTGGLARELPLDKQYVLGDLLDLMKKEYEYLKHVDNSDESIRGRIEKRKQKAPQVFEEFYETLPNEFDKHPFAERLNRSDPYNQIPEFLALYEELTSKKISKLDLVKRQEEIILTIMGTGIASDSVKHVTFFEVMQYMKAQLNRREIEQQGLEKQEDGELEETKELQTKPVWWRPDLPKSLLRMAWELQNNPTGMSASELGAAMGKELDDTDGEGVLTKGARGEFWRDPSVYKTKHKEKWGEWWRKYIDHQPFKYYKLNT